MEFSLVRLTENARDSEARGIGVQIVWKRRVEMAEDRCRSEELLEFFECGLRIGSPLKFRRVVLRQVVLRSKKVGNREYDAGVREDETAVKIAESKEHLDIVDGLGDRHSWMESMRLFSIATPLGEIT